jgi:hypothetical protein
MVMRVSSDFLDMLILHAEYVGEPHQTCCRRTTGISVVLGTPVRHGDIGRAARDAVEGAITGARDVGTPSPA